MRKFIVAICSIFILNVLAFAVVNFSFDDQLKSSVKRVIRQYGDFIVLIKYKVPQGGGIPDPDEPVAGDNPITSGGFLLNETGIVVAHSVPQSVSLALNPDDPAKSAETIPQDISIVLPNGKSVPADFIYSDRTYSLMFLKIKKDALDKEKIELQQLRYLTSSKPEVGDVILGLERKTERFDHAIKVRFNIVDSSITKPLKAYGCAMTFGDVMPVFNMSGDLLGLAINYAYDKELDIDITEELLILIETLEPLFEKAKK